MKGTEASFGRYGKTFQEGLVQLIYEDRPFADQITEVLDHQFLELDYLRVFLQKITNYRDRYGRHPSINDALKLGSENNFGYDYMADFEARFVPRHRIPCTTGWQEIDKICGGGLGKSELGVVVAPTGAGKSMVLVHLGSQAIKEGKTVVHYTMELQDTVIATRYDSCITGYPLSDIINFKEEVYEEIKDLDGTLIVKEYPTKSASTNTIKSHLAKLLKRGIKPGMIIVDYADLLKPTVVRKDSTSKKRKKKRTRIYL